MWAKVYLWSSAGSFISYLVWPKLIVTLKQVINRWSAHLWSSCGQPHKHRTNLFLHQAVNNINHISLKCCPASICHWVSTHLQK